MTRSTSMGSELYGTDRSVSAIAAALESGTVPVAVYGLGKMGLPLATVYAERTGRVVGVDTDPSVVSAVNDGSPHVTGEPELEDAVASVVADDWLRATTDGEAAAEAARVHVVIVPTLVEDGDPDLSTIEAVTDTIASGLARGDQVVVESTVPPGTARDVVAPRLSEASGLPTGAFGVAFCPERTKSGQALQDIRGSYPKVVGGVDPESTRVARAIYGVVTDADVLAVSDATTAECVKVFEGVYRDANIALANELATLADEVDVDVLEAIDAANTLPFCDVHAPGVGVGGHCIPVYPHFLIGGCETETPLLETARAVNDRMPAFAVDRLRDGLERHGTDLASARVAILGVTYRAGVDEVRNSPAISIAAELRAAGADVLAVDPICSSMDAIPAEPVELAALYERDLDGVVLATAHESFRDIDWERLAGTVVVDGRDVIDGRNIQNLYTIGRGGRDRAARANR